MSQRRGVVDPDDATANEEQLNLHALGGDPEPDDDPDLEPSADEEIENRLAKLEKQNFRMKLSLVVLVMVIGYLGFAQLVTGGTIVRQTLFGIQRVEIAG